MHEDGSDCGVDATAQGANHTAVPYFRSNRSGGFFDEGRAAPLFFRFANSEEKIAEDFGAPVGVADLGMELDGVNRAVGIFDSGNSTVRAAHDVEAWRESDDMVAVTIPD